MFLAPKNSFFVVDKEEFGWKLIKNRPFDSETNLTIVSLEKTPIAGVEIPKMFSWPAGQLHAETLISMEPKKVSREFHGNTLFPGTIWENKRGDLLMPYTYWDEQKKKLLMFFGWLSDNYRINYKIALAITE